MVDIIHRVGMKAPLSEVYHAVATVAGIAGWWTKDTTGSAEVGGTLVFRFQNPKGEVIGSMVMTVDALEPDIHVRWTVNEGPEEWIGTEITFDLHQEGDYTILIFGHRKWKEAVEFMAHCSMKWGVFLMSLKELVETGQGKPSPHDVKIDNWN